jgi:glycogen synthase
MLSLNQASELTGIPTPELLLFAFTGRIPFIKDLDTRMVFFDSVTLNAGQLVRIGHAKQPVSNF